MTGKPEKISNPTVKMTLGCVETLDDTVAGQVDFFDANGQGRGYPESLRAKQERVAQQAIFNETSDEFEREVFVV